MSLLSTLLFPVPPPSYSYHSFPNELLWIPFGADYGTCRTGDCIPAIFLHSPAARYLIIYFHSNGEDVGLCYSFGCGLRMVLEVHVLLVEYPGYGICPGECSEESLWRAAVAAFRFVAEVLRWPSEDIIIMGRSLGAAIATRLAGHFVCHGLILVAPFLSLIDAVSRYIGGLAPMLVKDMFSNRLHIGRVRVPTLIIHGQQDRLIPCSQGEKLYELCKCGQRKLYVNPADMAHNSDLLSNAEFLIRPMLRFFALPDYAFVDVCVPAQAFNKRLCPQYHSLVEMTKNDSPLVQPVGDQEPCPTHTTTEGPQWLARSFPVADGDLDDLEGSNEYTVLTHRSHARQHRGSPRLITTGDIGNTPRADVPVEGIVGSVGGGIHGIPRGAFGPRLLISNPIWLPDDDSTQSTTVGSSTVRLSDSNSGEEALSLPGLWILDIDNGISRFLNDASRGTSEPSTSSAHTARSGAAMSMGLN